MGLAAIGERLIPEKTRKVIKRVISSALIVALGVLQGPSQTDNVGLYPKSESEKYSNPKIGFIDNFRTENIYPPVERNFVAGLIYLTRLTDHGNMVLHAYEQILGTKIDKKKIAMIDVWENMQVDAVSLTDIIGNETYYIKIDTSEVDKFIDSQHDISVFNLSLTLGYQGHVLSTKRISGSFDNGTSSSPVIYNMDGKDGYYLGVTEMRKGKDGIVIFIDDKGNKINPINKEEYEQTVGILGKPKDSIEDLKMPRLVTLGALSKDNPFRKENHDILVSFAKRHPDKILVFAAGNQSDVYDQGDLPPNVVIACYMKNDLSLKGREKYPNYGDVGKGMMCVDNSDPRFKLEVTEGTSFSAPVVSAFISLEMLNGKSPLEAVDSLKKRAEKIDGNYILDPNIRRAIINEIESKNISNRDSRDERRKKE